MSMESERREVPRVYVSLYANVFDTSNGYGRFFRASILDLSTWGCKIKFQKPIDIYDSYTISFHFNNVEYNLPVDITEDIGDNIYRIKFIFSDLLIAKSLQLNIDSYMEDNNLKKSSKQNSFMCIIQ